jgi:hypothetical protein
MSRRHLEPAPGNTMRPTLGWWACSPVVPLLLLQAKSVRKRIPRLPDAAGSRSGEARVNPGVDTLHIAIVGESTAVGVGASTLEEALPGHLTRALAARTGKNVLWSVLGGNGMTVQRVLSSIGTQAQGRYDAAVVLLGVNDVFCLTPIKAWRSNLRLPRRAWPSEAARPSYSPRCRRLGSSPPFLNRSEPFWASGRRYSIIIWQSSRESCRGHPTAAFGFQRIGPPSRRTVCILRLKVIVIGRSNWSLPSRPGSQRPGLPIGRALPDCLNRADMSIEVAGSPV